MKGNLFKEFIITSILMLSILSCNTQKDLTTKNNFEYKNGKEKVTFNILSGNNYLIENQENLVKITLQNINNNALNISGKTIRMIKDNALKDNEIMLKISPTENDLENGHLILFVSYKTEKANSFKIKLPVKTKS